MNTLSNQKQKYFILIINIIIYSILELHSLPLLIILMLGSYYVSEKIRDSEQHKKKWLYISIISIITIWLFYKNLICRLPLGLSFYSFKIISFLIETYKGKIGKCSLLNYCIYVSFFPQILSGPISRPEEIITQIDKPYFKDKAKVEKGILLIVTGLFMKLVIADRLAVYVDKVFDTYQTQTGIALWLAAFFYTIQIYCDFAGYSNISIGIASIIGIDCNKNFDRPYFSKSISEFWSKWHISLSSWLRDYIYIPLGGNRKGKIRKCVNLLITFIVSGIWHGNGSGYIAWGIYHGVLSMIPTTKSKSRLFVIWCQLVTFIEVMFGWIFFKLESLAEGCEYIILMFKELKINVSTIATSILPFTDDNSCIAFFLIVLGFILLEFIIEIIYKDDYKGSSIRFILYVVSIVLFGMIGKGNFIYMNY